MTDSKQSHTRQLHKDATAAKTRLNSGLRALTHTQRSGSKLTRVGPVDQAVSSGSETSLSETVLNICSYKLFADGFLGHIYIFLKFC